MSVGIDALRGQFAKVVEVAADLGLDEGSGLRGQLRAAAGAIEGELKQWPNIDGLLLRMETMRKLEKDYILYRDDAVLGPHRKAFNEFDFALSSQRLDPATMATLGRLARAYRASLLTFVDGTRAYDTEVSAFNQVFEALGPKFDALLGAARDGMTAAVDTQRRVRDQARLTALLAGTGLVAGFMAIALFVTRSITRPLRSIEGVMERLAHGDRQTPVPGIDRLDEIGAMARAVQVFKENMVRGQEMEREARGAECRADEEHRRSLRVVAQDFDGAFGRVLDTVDGAAQQIRSGAHILRDTAEKMRVQAVDTAGKAEKTSAVVDIVSTVSQRLSSSIGEIGRRMTVSGAAVHRAVDRARRSDATVQALSESSQRIGEIVKLIQGVAGQTNLLALNATIEAARAGEAGRGFAVVAGEVKLLANQTARATEEIGAQIAAIQVAAVDVVDAIRSIRVTIEEVAQLSSEVTDAVSRQLTQTQEIADAVNDAIANSHDVSDSVGNMAEAAVGTGKSAIEMIYAAGQLSDELLQLKTDAHRFVLSIRA